MFKKFVRGVAPVATVFAAVYGMKEVALKAESAYQAQQSKWSEMTDNELNQQVKVLSQAPQQEFKVLPGLGGTWVDTWQCRQRQAIQAYVRERQQAHASSPEACA